MSNEPLIIKQCGNGFVVSPPNEVGREYKFEETRVFQTMSALVGYLAEHFTFRGEGDGNE